MDIKQLPATVRSFKLAAALEKYDANVRALGDTWLDSRMARRLRQEFQELRLLSASLPKVAVPWVAVLVSRTKLLRALCNRQGSTAATLLGEHLAAVERLRKVCLRMMGAQGAALA